MGWMDGCIRVVHLVMDGWVYTGGWFIWGWVSACIRDIRVSYKASSVSGGSASLPRKIAPEAIFEVGSGGDSDDDEDNNIEEQEDVQKGLLVTAAPEDASLVVEKV